MRQQHKKSSAAHFPWALSVLLIGTLATTAGTREARRMEGGGVLFAPAPADWEGALSGEPATLEWRGIGTQSDLGDVEIALRVDGALAQDPFGAAGIAGSGTLELEARNGETLRLYLDVFVRTHNEQGRPLPAPFPLTGSFNLGGGSGPLGIAIGYGLLTGSVLADGTLIYQLEGEAVGAGSFAPEVGAPADVGEPVRFAHGDTVDIVFADGVRFVKPPFDAASDLPDLRAQPFAAVHQRLLALEPGEPLTLPLPVEAEADVDAVTVAGRIPVFIDHDLRCFTLWAPAGTAEEPVELLFTGAWGKRERGHFTLSVRRPSFRFGDWNPELEDSFFTDPDFGYATLLLADTAHLLDTSRLPGPSADLYDSSLLDVLPGLNFYRQLRLYDLTRLVEALRALGIADTEIALQGSLEIDPRYAVRPLTEPPGYAEAVTLEAELPATGAPAASYAASGSTRELLRRSRIVERRLELEHVAGPSVASLRERLELSLNEQTFALTVVTELGERGVGATRARLAEAEAGSPWQSLEQAIAALRAAAFADLPPGAQPGTEPGTQFGARTAGVTLGPYPRLSLAELRQLLADQLGDSLPLPALGAGLPAGALDLGNVTIELTLAGAAAPAFAVSATATVLGTVTTEALLSSVSLNGSPAGVLVSLRPQQLTLGDIYPSSAAGDLLFPQVVLTYLESFAGSESVEIPAAALSPVVRAFYEPVYGAADFTLELEEGVNVHATYPLTQLPSLVLQTLRIDPASAVVVEGSMGMSLADLATGSVSATRGMYVKATLPTPSSPPSGFPARLQSVRLTELTLELAYLRPELVARVGAAFEAVLDGANRRFVGSTIVTLGEAPTSILLVAAMEGVWYRPFGVSWLNLEEVGALLWFNTDGSSRAELFGQFELAGRTVWANVELAASSGGASVAFSGFVEQLAPSELADLLRQHSGFTGDGLPAGIVELRDVSLSFAAGGDTSFGISADAIYEVWLDGANRRFVGPAEIGLSGGQLSLALDASLEDGWAQPFGVSWLDLDDVSFHLAAGDQQATGRYRSSFLLGSKRVELEIELIAGAGSSARFTGRVDQLSMAELTQLVQKHLPAVVPFEGSGLDLSFTDVSMTLEVGGRPSFSIAATTTLNGRSADLLFSATTKAGQTQVLTGLQLHDWSLIDPLPELRGTLIEQLRFETAALLLTKATGKLAAGDLSPEAYAFYRKVHLSDDFTLKLEPGVSLVAVLPIATSSPLRQPLETLGSAEAAVVVAGSLPGQVLGLGSGGGVAVRALLPPMSPSLPDGSKPPWFRSGQLAFFIEVAPGRVAAGLEGILDVTIDQTDMSFIVAGEFSGPPLAVTLSGRLETDEPWIAPFDVEWLTIRSLGARLSLNPATASLGLGFDGDVDIASKNLQVEIFLALNVTTGAPTNFIFRGSSTSSFSIDDLISLQHRMAAATGGPTVPTGVIPNLEIRPVSAEQPIELSFATHDGENVKPGFAVSGALWASLSPGGPLEEIATTDNEISTSGIFIDGRSPRDLGVAQLSLNQPTLKIEVEPWPPRGSFVLRGAAVFPWFTRTVEVDLDGGGNVGAAIQKITSIVATWNQFVDAFQQDPVAAVELSLTGEGGLFTLADVPEPPWVGPLFQTIGTMQDLFPTSDPRTVLEYALAGVDVTVPAGSGFPAGGRPPQGCPIWQTLHAGRCWDEVPFAGEELGYSWVCPTGTKENNQCWVVPPSATWTRGKVSYCCARDRIGRCTRTCWKCPLGTTESGGRCYGVPPGPPVLSSPSTPQKTCFGHDVGGKCWKLGRAPNPGSPPGGDDQICPLVAPIYAGDRCWIVPPTPEVQVEHIPGICRAQGTSCNVDGLLNESISRLIRNSVENLIAR